MSDDSKELEQEFKLYASLYEEEHAMTDALRIIGATKAAIDGIKALTQYGEEIKDTHKQGEFMRTIGQLSLDLAEVQMRLADEIKQSTALREESTSLATQIEQLKEEAKKRKKLDELSY